jgi:hypothetical protein
MLGPTGKLKHLLIESSTPATGNFCESSVNMLAKHAIPLYMLGILAAQSLAVKRREP